MSIVIINHRNPDLVIYCLRLLEEQIDINERCVILVDNASRDDSVLMLKHTVFDEQQNSWVTLIEFPNQWGIFNRK